MNRISHIGLFGLVILMSACQQAPQSQPIPEGQPLNEVEETFATSPEDVATLSLEEKAGFSFLYPLTNTSHPHTELDTDTPVHIEFFKYGNDDQLENTPFMPGNTLSTENGNILPYTYYDGYYYSFYQAGWYVNPNELTNGEKLRMEIRLDNATANAPTCNDGTDVTRGCLGFLDIQVWDSNVVADPYRHDGFLDVKSESWLPIIFHLEKGSLNPPLLDITYPELPRGAWVPNTNSDIIEVFTFDTPDIEFIAISNDLEDGNLTDNVKWFNRAGNQVAEGSSFTCQSSSCYLDPLDIPFPDNGDYSLFYNNGRSYVFTAVVTDSDGNTTTQEIRIRVVPPVIF